MLIEFRVQNFRSFRDEKVLSLIAARDSALPQNTFKFPKQKNRKLLKSAVVYGPNAAGKSNLIAAMSFVKKFVTKSADYQPRAEIPTVPFLLSSKNEKEPSRFELSFVHKGVRYQYGFDVDKEVVRAEWLFAYPKGKAQKWFERQFNKGNEQDYSFNDTYLRGEKSRIAKLTKPNSLYLSVAAKLNHKQLGEVYSWFEDYLRVIDLSVPMQLQDLSQFTAELCVRVTAFKERLVRLLRSADIGISELQVRKLEADELQFPDELKKLFTEEGLKNVRPTEYEFTSLHEGEGDARLVPIKHEDESFGTQKLFALSGPWFDTLANGYTLFIDELHASMHPLVTRHLLRLFHDPQFNSEGAQLVFACHDTSLLAASIFRRDQVWFVEKDDKGGSDLYSLHDYGPRKEEAFEKGYLTGRYGAIPFLGEFEF